LRSLRSLMTKTNPAKVEPLRVGSSTCRQDYSRMTGRGGAPLIGMERDCETDLNIVKIPPPQAPSAPTHERPNGLFQMNWSVISGLKLWDPTVPESVYNCTVIEVIKYGWKRIFSRCRKSGNNGDTAVQGKPNLTTVTQL
jgi:hypothetical protein